MPELPEVQVVVNTLKQVEGRVFKESFNANLPNLALELVEGQQIKSVFRRGKYILFQLDNGYLVSHLRMTGRWLFKADDYIRASFWLGQDDPQILAFSDTRKFATLEYVSDFDLSKYKPLSTLGVDGLALLNPENLKWLTQKFHKSKKPVKNLLLDQFVIAGCGNAYASEVLYRCNIHPQRPSRSLWPSEIKKLAERLQKLFVDSIHKGGISMRDYVHPDGSTGTFQKDLLVYGRKNDLCVACGTKICRIKQAGRSTFYCPTCQQL